MNRFTAFDSLCASDGCRGAGLPQVSVGLADLDLYIRVTDLAFAGAAPSLVLERSYNQESSADGPFGRHWSFSLGENIAVDADSSVVLTRGSGRIDRFAPSPGAATYFAATPTDDSLARDSAGLWIVKSPNGTARTFSPEGRLISVSDGPALRFTLEYDGSGKLSVARSHGRNLSFAWNGGRISSVSDSSGRTVAYSYDGANLVQHTGADGRVATYRYNDAGLISAIGIAGGSTAIAYSVDDVYTSVSSVTTPDGAVRAYDVPRSPREIRATDGAGNATLYSSSTLGLLESITDAYGNRTTFAYDTSGRRTRVTNAAGEATRFEYDGSGNLSAVVDGLGNRWSAEFGAGRLTRIVDPNGNGWSFGYDGNGSLTAVTSPAGATAAAQRTAAGAISSIATQSQTLRYQYDGDGMLTRFTDGSGNATAFQYDGAGRVSARVDGAGNQVVPEYGSGLRVTAINAGANRAALDDPGTARDPQGRVVSNSDAFGNQAQYAWNAAGRLARITLPGDRSITYDYDRAGRLAKVSDWAGNFAVYSYDAAGYPASVNVSGGPVTVYQYDAARNLKAVIGTGPDGSPAAAYSYTVDPNANRVAISALEPSPGGLRLVSVGFGYDNANRTVSRDSASYKYDAAGNAVSVQGGPELSFAYDPFGRLQSVSGAVNAGYAYDAAGLRASRSLSGTSRRYLYDVSGARPRVVLETDDANRPVAYYVWGLALLWKVSADGKAYFYHFDGDGNVVALSNPSAGVVNRYRYDALGRLVSSDEGVDNPFRARGASGVMDDGNGVLFDNGTYLYPDLRLALRGSIDVSPPLPALLPALAPAGQCFLAGVADCPLGAPGRLQ